MVKLNGSAGAILSRCCDGVHTVAGMFGAVSPAHTATALGAQDGAQNGDVLIVGIDGSTDL